jgi:hypothetical protein
VAQLLGLHFLYKVVVFLLHNLQTHLALVQFINCRNLLSLHCADLLEQPSFFLRYAFLRFLSLLDFRLLFALNRQHFGFEDFFCLLYFFLVVSVENMDLLLMSCLEGFDLIFVF